MASTVSTTPSPLTSTANTAAPSRANISAVARPNPDAAPVTYTARPSNRLLMRSSIDARPAKDKQSFVSLGGPPRMIVAAALNLRRRRGSPPPMTPLQNLKLLDLSRQLPGPFCSTMLADLGWTR
jgi:hypothetical protein